MLARFWLSHSDEHRRRTPQQRHPRRPHRRDRRPPPHSTHSPTESVTTRSHSDDSNPRRLTAFTGQPPPTGPISRIMLGQRRRGELLCCLEERDVLPAPLRHPSLGAVPASPSTSRSSTTADGCSSRGYRTPFEGLTDHRQAATAA